MTKIERKGDTLFYEAPETEWYAKDTKERRNAVKKEEILPTNQMFDLSVNNTWLEHRAMDKTISGITDDMETVTLHLISIHVSYFGDWEIKFK